jgi:hypothetical protein
MGLYYPPAIGDFDGAVDYLSRASDLVDNADSKTGILSVCVRLDGGDASLLRVMSSHGTQISIQRMATNKIQIYGKDEGGTERLNLQSNTSFTASATWLQVLASWDLLNGNTHLYVNDTDELNEVTAANAVIDYTRTSYGIAAASGGGNKFNGAIAELYFAPGQYLDFSEEVNRRKFIGADGYPVPLGANGSRPTGTAPRIYMRTRYDDCGKNSAPGGDFVINGSPSDTPGPRPDLRGRQRERQRQRSW